MKVKCKRCAGYGYTIWAPTKEQTFCDACNGKGIINKHENMDSIASYLKTLDESQKGDLDVLKLRNPNRYISPEELVDIRQKLATYQKLVAPMNKEIAELQALIWIKENDKVAIK